MYYTCFAWYPNLTKTLQHRIQTTQNKYMHFCLQLDKLKHISHEESESLSWLSATYRFKKCVNAIIFKYFNAHCPNYLNEVFDFLLTYSLTYSLTYLLTYLLACLLACFLACLLACLLACFLTSLLTSFVTYLLPYLLT